MVRFLWTTAVPELIFGLFREIIRPGAFDEVLNDDVRVIQIHDPNFIPRSQKCGHAGTDG